MVCSKVLGVVRLQVSSVTSVTPVTSGTVVGPSSALGLEAERRLSSNDPFDANPVNWPNVEIEG